jgi:hypothetical protein
MHDIANGGLEVVGRRGAENVEVRFGVGVEDTLKGSTSSVGADVAVEAEDVVVCSRDLPKRNGWMDEPSRSLSKAALRDVYASASSVSARPRIGMTFVSLESLWQKSMSSVVQSAAR